MSSLEKLRREIDRIDDQILSSLNKRIEIVKEIGELKQANNIVAYHPDREKEVYSRLKEKNKGSFPDRALEAVYREIMSASLAAESSLKIAYLGPEATFTHLAAKNKFGVCAQYLSVKSIADVFSACERGEANYGVVPIENTTEGVVTHTLDMFLESNLKICSESLLEVSLYLLSNSPISTIRRVYSHPQPFAQARAWLDNNLKTAERIEVSSTAQAAKLAGGEEESAAIATELAASIYGLEIIAERIEDRLDNYTRFLVIGQAESPPTGEDKTSILFSIKDKVGALYEMLLPFAKHKINLTKIESRPSRQQAWQYVFFVDLQGHKEEERVKKALGELEQGCVFLKVLGSYPVGS